VNAMTLDGSVSEKAENQKLQGKTPLHLPRERQVLLVIKLLSQNGEQSAMQVRKRAAKGQGVVAKGLEFDVSILREALATWDAQKKSENAAPGTGTDAGRSATSSPAGGKAGKPTAPVGSPGGKRQKRKVCMASDENKDPASRGLKAGSPKVARRHKSSAPEENPDLREAAATSRTAQRSNIGGSEHHSAPGVGKTEKAPPSVPATPRAAGLPRAASKCAGSTTAKPTPAAAPPSPPNGIEGLSAKELKSRLVAKGVDCAGCVEKADLQALWARLEMWLQRPLSELQDHCQVDGGQRFDSVEECARYLASSMPRGQTGGSRPTQNPPRVPGGASPAPPTSAASAPSHNAAAAPIPAATAAEAGMLREQDAAREVHRILPLRKESFRSPALWGFTVLEVPSNTKDVSVVQRAYRSLMRKLHPDRAGHAPEVAKANELVREAKEACERGLSRQEPPSAPRHVRSEILDATPGRRRFKICWTAPQERDCAPVRRYVVAAHDPAYGRALTITVLEPDYSQEKREFVGIEELTSFVMAEEDLQKMPKLWTQSTLNVQVAAANEAGQSSWTVLQVPLTGAAGAAGAAVAAPRAEDFDVGTFDSQLRKLRGPSKLRAWLEPQKKGALAAWLRSVNWSAQGSKQDLLERVIFIREAMPS